MPTRKEFCQCCLAMLLTGMGAPLALAAKGDEVKKTEGKGKKITGYCGIVCSECPAYVATQKNDDALRAETAKKWSEMFKSDIKPSDINCDGCPGREAGVLVEDCPGREAGVPVGDLPGDSARVFSYCAVCEIRKCAREKKVSTCAACPQYSCEKLDKFLAQVPEARKVLEELRQAI